jgi:hypothetical protein
MDGNANEGTMTKVYRFRAWDIGNDCYQLSNRWATKERIEKLGGEIASDPVEVDEGRLPRTTAGDEVEGMLGRNESPHPRSPGRMG